MQSLNWDDLRIFLALARAGRFAAAGDHLGVDHTTVARRLRSLEDALGARLVDRSPRGIELTPSGHALLAHAEGMEAQALSLAGEVGGASERLAGKVRLATPEGFGAFLVAPSVVDFATRYPDIDLELICDTRTVSLSRREADISIGLTCPTAGRVVARRLADFGLGLYASRAYLENARPIMEEGDLAGRPFVWYVDDLLGLPELRSLGEIASRGRIVFRSNSIVAQQNAIASGVGIGLLHRFVADLNPDLVLVLPEIEERLTYWLLIHVDYQPVPRVRAVVNFLEDVVARSRACLG